MYEDQEKRSPICDRSEAPLVTEEMNFPSTNLVLDVLIFKVLLLHSKAPPQY